MYNEFAIEGWGFLMIDAPNGWFFGCLACGMQGYMYYDQTLSAHTEVMLC